MAPYLLLLPSLLQPPSGAVVVKLDATASVRLSESCLVILTVEGREGLQVESSSVSDTPEWRVERQTKGEMSKGEMGRLKWQREIVLDPLGPGKLKLPDIDLRYRTGPGQEWTRHRFPDKVIDVPGPDGLDVRGQLPIEKGPVFPAVTPLVGREVLVDLVLVILFAALVWRLWRRRPTTAILPPDVRALNELELLRQAAPETIHAAVSSVVRRFVEERFSLHAPRQTSEEILQSARTSASFPPQHIEALAALLEECDRVKFTGIPPTGQECETIVTGGCQFVCASSAGGSG